MEFAPEAFQAEAGTVSVFVDNLDPTRHTFSIEELGVDLELPAGTARRVEFVAAPGTYEFFCAVSGHENMTGELMSAVRRSAMTAIVQAHGVRKVYRGGSEVVALDDVDLGIATGEMVAVVGPSGSGKTTLLNCLSGLERIDGGEVLVDGHDLSSWSDDERTDYRAKAMGFVFQAFNLLPVLTAVENVEIPLLLGGARAREARARSLELLEVVGLGERARHRPDQLSGGEQQRVAVARALVHRPAVVWADEPTGNLDTESSDAVMRLLQRLNAAGQTIVMVTHDPALAARAGRIVRMRDGAIENGSG